MPLQMASVTDWRGKYSVVDSVQKEVVTFTLWERILFSGGVIPNLSFFTTGPTTGLAGNMPLGAQLPNGWSFLVQALRIAPAVFPSQTAAAAPAAGAVAGALNDLMGFITNTTTQLSVGDKTYGRWPTFMLPAGGGPSATMSNVGSLTAPASSQIQFATNGVPDPRSVYSLGIPVVIPPQYQFSVVLQGAATLTTVTPNTSFGVFCMLDGQLMRPAQ